MAPWSGMLRCCHASLLLSFPLCFRDGPETFAVPDLDLPGMEMFQLPAHLKGRGGAAPASSGGGAEPKPQLTDELVPVPSGGCLQRTCPCQSSLGVLVNPGGKSFC